MKGKSGLMKPIELLAPAKDLENGRAAINCGADAVYIGAPQFGARETAGNPLSDIETDSPCAPVLGTGVCHPEYPFI